MKKWKIRIGVVAIFAVLFLVILSAVHLNADTTPKRFVKTFSAYRGVCEAEINIFLIRNPNVRITAMTPGAKGYEPHVIIVAFERDN